MSKRFNKRINVVSNQPKKNQKMLLGVFCMLLFAASIFVTIESATSSSELTQIALESKKVFVEIEDLSSGVVKGSSLGELEAKAENVGFAKPAQIVYIGKPADVAARIQ